MDVLPPTIRFDLIETPPFVTVEYVLIFPTSPDKEPIPTAPDGTDTEIVIGVLKLWVYGTWNVVNAPLMTEVTHTDVGDAVLVVVVVIEEDKLVVSAPKAMDANTTQRSRKIFIGDLTC